MELKIKHTPSDLLFDRFDIRHDRVEQLKRIVAVIVHEMESKQWSRFPLEEYYKKIASDCKTLEEFAYCMHIYIFYLARNGAVDSEPIKAN